MAGVTDAFRGKLKKMPYGGDYYPEQWDRSVWKEDMRLFRLAGIDFVRVNIFGWTECQPDEETYRFEWLDEVLDMLHRHDIRVGLGTGTAAHPAWMAKRYPDILRVDFEGRKRKYGSRHNSCPNSPTYRRFAPLLAEKLAERYKDHPALLLWNVSNEFGGECYCENCEKAFRVWLRRRYGTLERLNEAWNTKFWSHTFQDWDEIVAPNMLSEHFGPTNTAFQGISLDYARFNSDSLLECYLLEYAAIKRHMPDAVVTTNLMGAYKPLDYFKWAKHFDVVAWDNYPAIDTPASYTAMMHDLMRGLKNGQPFLLIEQTPSQQNWQPYNSLKRPGVMRLQSYQAVARGADSVCFFQMRRSIGACEKFHGAVVEHAGHEHTRVFRECAELGRELRELADATIGARVEAKVAVLFDWENWWAVEYSSGPSVALKYLEQVHNVYRALYDQNIPVDLIGVETDLEKYAIVAAPVLYMLKPGFAERVESFVRAGGTFLTTFFSGVVDENDRVFAGGYPGPLRRVLGIWVEERDALPPDRHNRIVIRRALGPLAGEFACSILFDILHCETAETIAVYGDDFYAGTPAVTVNRFGEGEAWYVASSAEPSFWTKLFAYLCESRGISAPAAAPEGVEAVLRVKPGREFLFLLNHANRKAEVDVGAAKALDRLTGRAVSGVVELPPYGVAILERRTAESTRPSR